MSDPGALNESLEDQNWTDVDILLVWGQAPPGVAGALRKSEMEFKDFPMHFLGAFARRQEVRIGAIVDYYRHGRSRGVNGRNLAPAGVPIGPLGLEPRALGPEPGPRPSPDLRAGYCPGHTKRRSEEDEASPNETVS